MIILIASLFFSPLFSSEQLFNLKLINNNNIIERSIKYSQKGDENDFANFSRQDKTTPLNYETFHKFVVIGDTGCRLKLNKLGQGAFQECSDESIWPIKQIAQNISSEKGEAFIHLGDYHYREECGIKDKCEKLSPIGYGWIPWKLDFFSPFEKILNNLPLLAVRGNHEDCNRAFAGYLFTLNPNSNTTKCSEIEETSLTTIHDAVFVNLDTSSPSDNPLWSSEEELKWLNLFNSIHDKLSKIPHKKVFLFTHKPFYGVVNFKGILFPSHIVLRKIFEKSLLYKDITAIFSGHIHVASVSRAPNNGPWQIVIGNSGTKLDDFKSDTSSELIKSFNYQSLKIVSKDFGYGILYFEKHWAFSFNDLKMKILETVNFD